jgi:hypothetical protein
MCKGKGGKCLEQLWLRRGAVEQGTNRRAYTYHFIPPSQPALGWRWAHDRSISVRGARHCSHYTN